MATYELAREVSGRGWLSLHRNENLFINHDWVSELVTTHIKDKALFTAYPDALCLPLRETLATMFSVTPDNVYVGNGADGVLADLLTVLRREHESLSVLDIGFRVYHLLASRLGYKLHTIPGDTFYTRQVFPDGSPHVYVVDSPNSVTGVRLPSDKLLGLASDRRSFLIWDNVYGDFEKDTHGTICESVAFVRSFSKYYGLAGLRIGYCIAHEELIAKMLAIKDIYNVNAVAQLVALEALRNQDYFDAVAKRILRTRDMLVAEVKALGFHVCEPGANFLFVTHPRYSAEQIQLELEKRQILVRRFTEASIANYLRVTVPPLETLPYLVGALQEVIDQLGSRVMP